MTLTTGNIYPAAQHNMIWQCYCLGTHGLQLIQDRNSNIWVYQQVVMCTDDVVMRYMS